MQGLRAAIEAKKLDDFADKFYGMRRQDDPELS
jgi:hypothetical protein